MRELPLPSRGWATHGKGWEGRKEGKERAGVFRAEMYTGDGAYLFLFLYAPPRLYCVHPFIRCLIRLVRVRVPIQFNSIQFSFNARCVAATLEKQSSVVDGRGREVRPRLPAVGGLGKALPSPRGMHLYMCVYSVVDIHCFAPKRA